MMAPLRGRLAWIADAGMTALLAMLGFTIFVVPIVAAPFGDAARTLVELFYVLVLLCGAWAIAEHRGIATLLAALAAAALAIAWLPLPGLGTMRPLLHEAAALVAAIMLAAMVGVRVFSPGRITVDRIMGAVALYLLLGVAWGSAYEIVAQVDANAFSAPVPGAGGVERWFYFSFVTLTTVGYGDVTPVARAARVLAIGEALVGQLYPAVVLARLVTLQAPPPAD
ncbi:MAG: potassium channel family protein [Burkholderiales bacterium]